MNVRHCRAAIAAGLVALTPIAVSHAQSPTTRLDAVQVTATRFGDPVLDVPGAINVVTGAELRDRGATDLRTALALIPGVSVAPVSDAGPAGSVPGLLGMREIDDLLLLIDGIPAGGSFVPQVAAISLTNVERIEILRGAAPVYFGTTAFAGTVNVIHYAAGRAESAASVRYGSCGSVGASGSAVLSTGAVAQSLAIELGNDRYSDSRARKRRGQLSWRLATDVAGGTARADINLLALRQKPTSPEPIDTTTGRFTTLLPDDFNQNPADAKLDTNRAQFVLGFDRPLPFGQWGNTLSYTGTRTDSIRGFIDVGDTPQPWTPRTNADLEAFRQALHQRDFFFDTHVTAQALPGLDITTGVNVLLGHADANSSRENFRLLLDGQASVLGVDAGSARGTVSVNDDRRFLGAYVQSRYRLASNASLLAGLRWNQTHEHYREDRVNSRGVPTDTDASQSNGRLSGSFGGQWRALQDAGDPFDGVTLHASVGNTFQPAQIDFGPNPEAQPEGGGLLKPETQRSIQAGARTASLDGMLEFDVDGFFVNFDNQPVVSTSAGSSVLSPRGRERYRGVDVEAIVRPTNDWTVKANATWADARFRDFVTDIDGAPTQLSGKRQILAPALRAATGVIYAPPRGWRGSLTTTYTGPRYLDLENRFKAVGFAVVDASVGYRFDRTTLTLAFNNITNRRDPVLASELGDGEFYRMTARRVEAILGVDFR